MSKIRDTLAVVQSGARNNKYRILFPLFGQEIDILCNATTNPGREIGTVEVFLKGRKYQMAGDMNDEGTWSMTIYNTEDFLVRSFFLMVIGGIQNFNTPLTMDDGYNQLSVAFNGFDYGNGQGNIFNSGNQGRYDFLTSIGQGALSSTLDTINTVYNEMRSNWNTVSRAIDNVRDIINSNPTAIAGGPILSNNAVYNGDGNYAARPWYMSDIVIQQLDSNDKPVTTTTLHNAFASAVGSIEYTDETGDISKTEITFTYSGITYGVDGYRVTY